MTKKVAIAFFGQPRGINNDKIINQWLQIFKDSEDQCDFDVYAHFWDQSSNTKISETYEEFVKETPVGSDEYFSKFISEIKPKNIEISPSSILDELSTSYFGNNEYIHKRVDPKNPSTGRATIGQWYSTEQVLSQVINSKIKYDTVIRIRPDILFVDYHKNHRFFEISLVNAFNAMSTGKRCIGVPSIEIKSGTPILNDWWTVIHESFVEEFKTNLTKNIATQINAIFTTSYSPNSIQENALHRHCIKSDIEAVATHLYPVEACIYREEEGEWQWPNYSEVVSSNNL